MAVGEVLCAGSPSWACRTLTVTYSTAVMSLGLQPGYSRVSNSGKQFSVYFTPANSKLLYREIVSMAFITSVRY